MGEVLTGKFGGREPITGSSLGAPDVEVTKQQLAKHPAVRRSARWVEQQLRAGMPAERRVVRGIDRPMFRLPVALAWLAERGKLRSGVSVPSAPALKPATPEKPTAIKAEPTVRANAAADVLGVTVNVLGRWERRYGYPEPERTRGGHRTYVVGDLYRLRDALAETGDIGMAIERVCNGQQPEPPVEATRSRNADIARELDELRLEVRRLSAEVAALKHPGPPGAA